jgi:predicted transcriptional regulator with HTH domain
VLAGARGPVDAVELAWRLRVSPRRLRAVLHGDGRGYRVSDSLVALGLAARVRGRFGPAYVLTLRGRAEVEGLARLRASSVPV